MGYFLDSNHIDELLFPNWQIPFFLVTVGDKGDLDESEKSTLCDRELNVESMS